MVHAWSSKSIMGRVQHIAGTQNLGISVGLLI